MTKEQIEMTQAILEKRETLRPGFEVDFMNSMEQAMEKGWNLTERRAAALVKIHKERVLGIREPRDKSKDAELKLEMGAVKALPAERGYRIHVFGNAIGASVSGPAAQTIVMWLGAVLKGELDTLAEILNSEGPECMTESPTDSPAEGKGDDDDMPF